MSKTYMPNNNELYKFKTLDGTFSLYAYFGDIVTVSSFYGVMFSCTYEYFENIINLLQTWANETTTKQLYEYFL